MGQTSSLELQIPKNKTYNGVKEDAQRHDFAGYEARSMKWNWPDTSVGSSSLGFQHHLLLLILGVQHKSREPGIKWDWFVVIASAWTSRQLVQKKKKKENQDKNTQPQQNGVLPIAVPPTTLHSITTKPKMQNRVQVQILESESLLCCRKFPAFLHHSKWAGSQAASEADSRHGSTWKLESAQSSCQSMAFKLGRLLWAHIWAATD